MQPNPWALAAVVLVLTATSYLGHRLSQYARPTDDFLVARRTVRSRRNASAISGEYLCAASFLGVSGLVLKEGADALWYPIGFTVGFLALGIFVAAPLRRSGAYTIPDFLEARLGSTGLRVVSTVFVAVLGLVYLVPQLQGASLALTSIAPEAETWWGPALVAAFVTANVLLRGMRSATLVQAFSHWVKLFALAIPAFVLSIVFLGSGGTGASGGLGEEAPPEFTEETMVTVGTDVVLRVDEPTMVHELDEDPPGPRMWVPGIDYPARDGERLLFPASSAVPVVVDAESDNASWLQPAEDGDDVWWTYSVIVATFFGTMGLPHVLARFYTNPDGRAARRTTVQVLLLLGVFYLFPVLLGALSRMYVPELLVTGENDAAVLRVPSAMLPGVVGQLVVAVLAAGAFAAFVSTSSGLVVSVSGMITSDLMWGKQRDFIIAMVGLSGAAVAVAVALPLDDLVHTVGLAFALAASTFCPLLLLGIWWRRLTWVGALLGMLVGGIGALSALAGYVVARVHGEEPSWFLAQPALLTVPAALLTTVVVSLATARRVPEDVDVVMLQLHAPDRLGFMRDPSGADLGEDGGLDGFAGRHRRP
ncbi:sodium/solute symporter [Saccharomonospora xinjiangensis]|uniref:Putative symporter n=1 Tax=Saccharomonospora xinjiangensis XJ-54 TaxID=882086 RepID=I0V256_9PSEU|nr:cation acetate symporter [Saccharomonospora xinjiangensis]EID54209.1 putative symporter [Saccharomonospora xinjiangensis XJ-54]